MCLLSPDRLPRLEGTDETRAAWISPGSVFLRRGCSLLVTVLLLLVPLLFTWLLACCWSLNGVFVVLSTGSDASRRRGDVGVGGAPLAMLLRLDVELLRLPGPATKHESEITVLLSLRISYERVNHPELLMLFLQCNTATGCSGDNGTA
jgi:membrane glycosyltransferase